MIEVVAFAGALAHAGEHRVTGMFNGDIADQFHHVDGLADARAAKQADLAALGERTEQVNHLDPGFQQFGGARLILKRRGWLVDAAQGFGLHRSLVVNRLAQHVHDPAQGRCTHRHRNRRMGVTDLHVPLQSFGRSHRDGAHHAVAQLLLHFQRKAIFINAQRIINFRHRPAWELDIHHRADDLHDIARTHSLGSP